MAGMKISDLDFVRLLPAFMHDDEAAIALSKAMNKRILLLLVKNAGKVFSIDQIYEAIWNEEAIGAGGRFALPGTEKLEIFAVTAELRL